MGQTNTTQTKLQVPSAFNDLHELPPELALAVLSNLNATDLCLAACVWKELAEDEILWKGLCYSRWKYATAYRRVEDIYVPQQRQKPTYKSLYLLLDEATLIYRYHPHEGIQFLIESQVIEDSSLEVAKFLDGTDALDWKSVRSFLEDRRDVLDQLVELQDFTGMKMIDALRLFFTKMTPHEERRDYLDVLVEKFAIHFCRCNTDNSVLSKESVTLLCYSLLLLSVDLYSPHNRNKMTKREFICNNRQPVSAASAEFLGDLYDEVYLNGHVAGRCSPPVNVKKRHCFPFLRPYGALFELRRTPATAEHCWCC